MVAYYGVSIVLSESNTFNAYIIVLDDGEITNMNDYTNEILVERTNSYAYVNADNLYPITNHGFNFMSSTLQQFYNSDSMYYNIYFDVNNNKYSLFSYNGNQIELESSTISIEPISDISCYGTNTYILCENNTYIPIYELHKDMNVKTYKEGYKKIMHIGKVVFLNNPKDFTKCVYRMKYATHPHDNLIITGWHSILVDELSDEELLITKQYMMSHVMHDKYLLLSSISKSFDKCDEIKECVCYHIVLESDDIYKKYGIWANGVLFESISLYDFKNNMVEI